MKILRKIIDWKNLEKHGGNIYEGVCFSEVARLMSKYCNGTLKRLQHKLFPKKSFEKTVYVLPVFL